MPRGGLNAARVVEEAERISDELGLPNLTLTGLANRLGVRQPSLYKHIASIDGLHRSIAVRAKRELAQTLGAAAVGRSGADALASMARSYRRWALEHPGRYEATQRYATRGDVEAEDADRAGVEVVAAVLAGFGLGGEDAIHAIRGIRSALHGFVSLEAGGGFGLPVDIEGSFERLVDALVGALAAGTEESTPASSPRS